MGSQYFWNHLANYYGKFMCHNLPLLQWYSAILFCKFLRSCYLISIALFDFYFAIYCNKNTSKSWRCKKFEGIYLYPNSNLGNITFSHSYLRKLQHVFFVAMYAEIKFKLSKTKKPLNCLKGFLSMGGRYWVRTIDPPDLKSGCSKPAEFISGWLISC